MSFSEGEGGRRAADLVLEGQPPGSDRPSWLVLVIGVVAALLIGLAVGYGVGSTPSTTPESTVAVASSQASPSPTTAPAGHVFIADPCQVVRTASLFTGDPITTRRDPSALPGMAECTYLDPSGQVLAGLSVRQAPTSSGELAVTVDELFQGEGVSEASIAGRHAYFIPCARAWRPCRPAVAVIREPYFLVISVQSGGDDLRRVSALAAGILGSLPN